MSTSGASRLGPEFVKYWGANAVSALGDGVSLVAMPLLVASISRDPLLVSGAVLAANLPWLLFSLLSGGIADRLDRRKLMVAVDLLRALAVAGLGTAVVLDRVSLPLIYTVAFLVGTGETLFKAAGSTVLPTILPHSLLEKANGRLFGTYMVVHDMLAGPLGAALFVVAMWAPFYVDAVSLVLAAVLLMTMRGTFRAAPVGQARSTSLGTEIADGIRWLFRHRLLRTLALLMGLLNVTLMAALSILVLLATDRLGLGEVGYGLLFTALAAGGLVGSLGGDWLVRKVTATWTLRVGLIVETVFHLVMAISTNPYVIAVNFAAFGVHGALWGLVSTSIRQRLTPPAMLGRVSSVYLFIVAGGNAIGALLGGVIATHFGLTAPYWIGFVVAVGVTAATWRVFSPQVIAAAYAPAREAESTPV